MSFSCVVSEKNVVDRGGSTGERECSFFCACKGNLRAKEDEKRKRRRSSRGWRGSAVSASVQRSESEQVSRQSRISRRNRGRAERKEREETKNSTLFLPTRKQTRTNGEKKKRRLWSADASSHAREISRACARLERDAEGIQSQRSVVCLRTW
ncbi:hypothetical protein TGARI_290150 [Toxoplasma gondii ARI]|uniref:Uncharacterized protein n=1 Tax=Toxoplasma gondii ARI TaxID=1074872 RepID=A0A139Y1Z4_TOXGO|nr:hypothetical protein TGARI_290150 [Toxoplasma gondii ARI]